MLNQLKLILEVSYLEFGTDHISPLSFTFGWAFYRLPKPPFSCFARATVQVRAWAITRASCQGLHIQRNLKYCCFFFTEQNKSMLTFNWLFLCQLCFGGLIQQNTFSMKYLSSCECITQLITLVSGTSETPFVPVIPIFITQNFLAPIPILNSTFSVFVTQQHNMKKPLVVALMSNTSKSDCVEQ